MTEFTGRYRKRPVEIKAVQLNDRNWRQAYQWIKDTDTYVDTVRDAVDAPDGIVFRTPEGDRLARVADWIVRDGAGGFRKYTDEDFQVTYEPAAAPSVPADRAAVLREADWIVEHCPDHGCVEPETDGCHCEIAERLRRMADEAQQDETEHRPTEDLLNGTQQCGHDDYHDAHSWADQPHIWCPGHSYDEDAAQQADTAGEQQ